jgi:hypothetical protein
VTDPWNGLYNLTMSWTGLDVAGSCLDYDRAMFVSVDMPGIISNQGQALIGWYVYDDE